MTSGSRHSPSIALTGVCKAFGSGQNRTVALDSVDLAVAPGEIVLLMGPSGSGKTTLLSIMGCILKPDQGSVRVAGTETTGCSQEELARIRLAHIGFIFQEYHLFNTLSAVQNVMVSLDLKGISGPQAMESAARTLELVGLGQRLGEYPENLSGGQKQRLAIARALAGGPEIILADEPTAALDSENGRNVLEILHGLAHRDGRTVIIVTHDPRISTYADRIVTIEDGRVGAPPKARTQAESAQPLHGGNA